MRLLFAALPILLLLLFALSNRQAASVGLWPTDYQLVAPLYLLILLPAAGTFLLGALLLWGESLRQRRRAGRAETRVRLLEAQAVAAPSPGPTPTMPALTVPILPPIDA